MKALYPPELIQRIREASDLVAIAGGYVKMRKAGGRYTGLCPFHKEKTPSFSIQRDREQRWRWSCFGKCSEKGDVFDFIARIEGTDFRGAVERLASLSGIAIEAKELTAEHAKQWARERHSYERDLPAASLWRRAAVEMADEILLALKAGLFDPTLPAPAVGEIADWERRVAHWRDLSGETAWDHDEKRLRNGLVDEYRAWRKAGPVLTSAMVKTTEQHSIAEIRAAGKLVRVANERGATAA